MVGENMYDFPDEHDEKLIEMHEKYEEYLKQKIDERDAKLIEEHENYEEWFYEQIIDEMMENDAINALIADRFDYIDETFDFEPSPEYEHLEELYSDNLERDFREKLENEEDFIDYIDYPEGPNENLDGVYYGNPYEEPYDNFEPDYPDLAEEEFIKMDLQQDFNPENEFDIYEQLIDDAFLNYIENEEKYFEKLIEEHLEQEKEKEFEMLVKQHLEEEKKYLDHLLAQVIIEENYFEKAIDELIFDEIDLDYDEDLFDYDDIPGHGNDSEVYPPDESVIDPFDSLGDIDYPEGEVYPKPPTFEEEYPEDMDEIETVFKDYFTKDDTLNKIVKKKVKEKKFNK